MIDSIPVDCETLGTLAVGQAVGEALRLTLADLQDPATQADRPLKVQLVIRMAILDGKVEGLDISMFRLSP